MSRGQGLSGRGARARALGQRLQGWEAGPLGGGQGCGRKEGGASQWSTSFESAGNPRGDWASREGLGNN